MRSDMSPLSSRYMEATSSSTGYRSKGQNSSYQSRFASDIPSTTLSRRRSPQGSPVSREDIQLVQVPMKYNDLLKVFQASGQYKDKSPILINMKKQDIDKIIEKQHNHNSGNSVRPERSVRQSIKLSPVTSKQPDERDYHFERLPFEPVYKSPNEQTSKSDQNLYSRGSKPPLGDSQAQVYAMTGIQAYPMIGANGSVFMANKSRKKTPRKKSKRNKSRSRTRKPKTRSRSRRLGSKFRGRSRRHGSPRTKKTVDVRSSKSIPRARSTVIVRRKTRPVSGRRRASPLNTRRRRISPPLDNRNNCTPYVLCDYDCTPEVESPFRRSSRPLIGQKTAEITCNCTRCQEKLQFIQPGVCTQKKNMWTNEYAIIPKPQVNLIDPCKELDPSIYPRADRPCIRDGRGNPLTDCIGRPLRDPVGKRFLNFNANGSVMDTNFRGNFFTGQPPVCVKCPMPGTSCAPDTTHNWWMSCGYPVKANMAPFFNKVVAAENVQRRC